MARVGACDREERLALQRSPQSKISDRPSVLPLEDQLEALGIPFSRSLSASSFDLVLSRPQRPEVAAQIDGEEWVGGQHFRVTVLPRQLPLIVPKGFQAPWR